MPTYTIRLRTPTGEHSISCAADQAILDAAEARGIALPYSCRSAACGTCVGKVESGTVELEDQSILSDTDVDRGFTCLCQAQPRSDCVILTHQRDEIETV